MAKVGKGKKRKAGRTAKQQRRARMASEGSIGRGESRYARKRKWLDSNGLWGFEVPHPKPW